jgi:hypothetical protein
MIRRSSVQLTHPDLDGRPQARALGDSDYARFSGLLLVTPFATGALNWEADATF